MFVDSVSVTAQSDCFSVLKKKTSLTAHLKLHFWVSQHVSANRESHGRFILSYRSHNSTSEESGFMISQVSFRLFFTATPSSSVCDST